MILSMSEIFFDLDSWLFWTQLMMENGIRNDDEKKKEIIVIWFIYIFAYTIHIHIGRVSEA